MKTVLRVWNSTDHYWSLHITVTERQENDERQIQDLNFAAFYQAFDLFKSTMRVGVSYCIGTRTVACFCF